VSVTGHSFVAELPDPNCLTVVLVPSERVRLFSIRQSIERRWRTTAAEQHTTNLYSMVSGMKWRRTVELSVWAF